jgi:hypothetical protein
VQLGGRRDDQLAARRARGSDLSALAPRRRGAGCAAAVSARSRILRLASVCRVAASISSETSGSSRCECGELGEVRLALCAQYAFELAASEAGGGRELEEEVVAVACGVKKLGSACGSGWWSIGCADVAGLKILAALRGDPMRGWRRNAGRDGMALTSRLSTWCGTRAGLLFGVRLEHAIDATAAAATAPRVAERPAAGAAPNGSTRDEKLNVARRHPPRRSGRQLRTCGRAQAGATRSARTHRPRACRLPPRSSDCRQAC